MVAQYEFFTQIMAPNWPFWGVGRHLKLEPYNTSVKFTAVLHFKVNIQK